MNHPRILGIGTANPLVRLTQGESPHAAGCQGERIRKIFLTSDIGHRHFRLEGTLNRGESSDPLNQRYLRGAMKTGCRAILSCLKAATVHDVDFLAVCTCTGYVCPDVCSRLIAPMRFINNLQRAPIVGLGCAGALPMMQRAADFVRANPGCQALMLAVEIWSARYFVDNTLEMVVGNAICTDGAAAFLLATGQQANHKVSTNHRLRGSHRYGAHRGGWTSTSRRKAANRARSFGSTPARPHDRRGTPAIVAPTWAFEISHPLLGRSSAEAQGD